MNNKILALCLGALSVATPASANDFYQRITSNDPGSANFSLDVGDLGSGLQQGLLLPTSNASGQYWQLVPAGLGSYKLTNSFQGNVMCLDVAHDGGTYMDNCGVQIGQLWQLEEVVGQGVRLLNAFKPGQCLDYMTHHEPTLNMQIGIALMTNCNGSASQVWSVRNTGRR